MRAKVLVVIILLPCCWLLAEEAKVKMQLKHGSVADPDSGEGYGCHTVSEHKEREKAILASRTGGHVPRPGIS